MSLLLIQTLFFNQSFGQNSIIVNPKRIVFEGHKRTQVINIANMGLDTVNYEVSIIRMRMNSDGSFQEIKEDTTGENGANSYLRVYPRIIRLGPNEDQTVKVQLINNNKMQPGEYRSHICIRTARPPRPKDYKPLVKMVTNLNVTLMPLFGITIPAIIRVGPYSATLKISDLSFKIEKLDQKDKKEVPTLSMNLNRSGIMSTYGNLSVLHITPEGLETNVSLVKGVAIYMPNATRAMKVALSENVGVDYHKGKLRVIYSTQIEDRFVKMADAELFLGN